MAKFDLFKHKQLADEKRLAKNPDLGNPNTQGMKLMKSFVGLIMLVFLVSNVSTIPAPLPLLWLIYALLAGVYGWYLRKKVWL